MNVFFKLVYKIVEKYREYYYWKLSPMEGLHKLQVQGVAYGKQCRILGPISIRKDPNSKIIIGDAFFCQSGSLATMDVQPESKIQTESNACLMIGDNVGMSSIVLHCWNKIVIGNNVKIGAGCVLFDTNFHNTDYRVRCAGDNKATVITKPIIIEDNVFIGARSIICKGVHIGKNSLIAAGSVVVSDIPDDEMWGGNPANFIKSLKK